MSRPLSEVRTAGLFLSIYSTAITRPITSGVFESLKRNLIHLHTDTDANFRREVHGYTQKLFERLRASTATLSKDAVKKNGVGSSRMPMPKLTSKSGSSSLRCQQDDLLFKSLEFVAWYVHFIEWEMRSTASYQRRITALQSLIIVLRSGIDPCVAHCHLSKSAQGQLKWAHGLQIASAKLLRLLLDLIMDPFDDIRNTAVSILQLCLPASGIIEEMSVSETVHRALHRAETSLLRSGRADQADGIARAYSVLFTLGRQDLDAPNPTVVFDTLVTGLKVTLSTVHKNLSEAVGGHPVHGILAAMRYVYSFDLVRSLTYPDISLIKRNSMQQLRKHRTIRSMPGEEHTARSLRA